MPVFVQKSVFFLFTFLVLVVGATESVWGQTTIWSENFDSYTNGTQQGSGTPVKWDINPKTGYGQYFEVRGGNIRGEELDQEGVFTSEEIDISSFQNIAISVDISAWGNMEPSDYLRIYYVLDSGAEIFFNNNGNNSSNFGTLGASTSGLNGSTLQIVIRALNSANNEIYEFANILVQGTPTAPPPCTYPILPYDNEPNVAVDGTLSWNAMPGSTGYKIYFGTDAAATNIANGVDLGNVTSYTPSTNLSFLSDYYWRIVPYNSYGDASGCSTWSFTTVDISYCIPSGLTFGGISGVLFNNINNQGTGLDGYIDYTSIYSTDAIRGNTYNLSVFVNTGGDFTQYQKVWIDWNQDGEFNTIQGSSAGLGEEYMLGTATYVTNGLSSLCPLSVTIPSGATLGNTRMRVSSAYQNQTYTTSCATEVDAEFEDYTVNVLPACTAPDVPTVSASSTAICSGDNIALTITGNLNSATEWVVYTGSCGGTQIGTTTTNTFMVNNVTTATTYYVRGEGSSCDGTQCGSATVTVNPSGAVGVSISADPSGAVCTGTIVTYTATPTNGGTAPSYQWKVNGTNVGTDSNIFSYEPADGDEISCVLTSNSPCATSSASVPILFFSWDDDTKQIIDSDFGLDAVSVDQGAQYSSGALAPGSASSGSQGIDLTFSGAEPELNFEGLEYSVDYRRGEGQAEMFTRGAYLVITSGSNFSVSYRIGDGAGSFTTVSSGNVYAIPLDDTFHNYRFLYNPQDGIGRLIVDNDEKWQSSPTAGQPLYWDGASGDNLLVGKFVDASGTQVPTFDNLSIKAINEKTAIDEITVIVNPLPIATISGVAAICNDGSTTPLTINFTGTGPWEVTTQRDGANDISVTNISVNPYTFNVSAAGTYTISAFKDAVCAGTTSGSATVTVNPLPTITLSSTQGEVCFGDIVTTFGYAATTGSPNQYSIDFDPAAESQGFIDVSNVSLTTDEIAIVVPAAGVADTYYAVLTVKNSTTGCTSINYNITIIIHPLPDTSDITTN